MRPISFALPAERDIICGAPLKSDGSAATKVSAHDRALCRRTRLLWSMKMVIRPALLLLFVVIPGRGVSQPNAPSLVFTHLTVIDGTGAPAQTDMTAVVTDRRIADLSPSTRVRVPPNAQVIDGTGKFLAPGLWDMHVHTLRASETERFFRLFVANGVTGVRDMGGPPYDFPRVSEWKKRTADGTSVGPRLVAGPMLDGNPPVRSDVSVPIVNSAEGRAAVRQLDSTVQTS